MRGAWLALLMTGAMQAHDLAVLPRVAGEVVLVAANFGGSEPATFCQVAVFSPAKADAEFQTGRTDARGRFAFQPDVAGRWRVVVDDEMGHRQEATVEWAGVAGAAPEGGAVPGWQKALTGGSLLLGLTGIWLWWRVRGQL
jgi:nickel transport protein